MFKQYYLNNCGDRTVSIDEKGRREKIPVKVNGVIKLRAVDFWQQCGDFAFPMVRIKGKRVAVYPEFETNCDGNFYQTFKDKYGYEAKDK